MELALVIGLCLLAAGCMTRSRVADFTVLSSKNVSTLEGAQNMGTFEGKDCRSMLGGQMPNQKEAVDRALEAGKGNAMIDAVVYFKPAACIFDSTCWEIKGTVIKTKDLLLKKSDLRSLPVDAGYVREILSSPDGGEFLALRKKSAVDLDNDRKHYDLILRIQ
jgi:hypothetical protein